jgi:hypothetical protein
MPFELRTTSPLQTSLNGALAFMGGYGQGRGQQSGALVSAAQLQMQPAKAFQEASQQSYNWMQQTAYQQRSQEQQIQMQNMAHQNAMQRLGTENVAAFQRNLLNEYGIIASPDQVSELMGGGAGGPVSSGGYASGSACGPGGCGPSAGGGAQQIDMPSIGGAPSLLASSKATQAGLPPVNFPQTYDPTKGSIREQLQATIQQRQQAMQQAWAAKNNMEMRPPGDTPEMVSTNKATYAKAQQEAQAVMGDNTLDPIERQAAAQQIMGKVQGLAPSYYPKLQPSPEQVKQQFAASVVKIPMAGGGEFVAYQSQPGKWTGTVAKPAAGATTQPAGQEQQRPLPPNAQRTPFGTIREVLPPPPDHLGGGPPAMQEKTENQYWFDKDIVRDQQGRTFLPKRDTKGNITAYEPSDFDAEAIKQENELQKEAVKAIVAQREAQLKEQQKNIDEQVELAIDRAKEAINTASGDDKKLSADPYAYMLQHNPGEFLKKVRADAIATYRPRAATSQPAPSSNGAPALGAVVDGYRYMGGNPNDPKSWDKVK